MNPINQRIYKPKGFSISRGGIIKLSIILPTYKEAENLLILIPQLIKKFSPYEIIVVDDDSKDGTEEILRHFSQPYKETIEHNNYKELKKYKHNTKIKLIERKDEKGIGSALAKGYDSATGDVLLSIDADLSMELDDVPKLLKKLNEGYDVVVGSRYVRGGKNRKEAFVARIASIIGNWIFDKVFKLPVHDVSMNFRILKKSVWNEIRTEEEDNVMLLEMLVLSYRRGYKIAEIPTVFGDRVIGESKTNIWRLIPKYIRFIRKAYKPRKTP